MKTKIARWGNSLAVRVPQPFAEEVGIEEGTEIDLALDDGRLVLTPMNGRKWSLERLVERITPDNRHDEVEIGPATGSEVW